MIFHQNRKGVVPLRKSSKTIKNHGFSSKSMVKTLRKWSKTMIFHQNPNGEAQTMPTAQWRSVSLESRESAPPALANPPSFFSWIPQRATWLNFSCSGLSRTSVPREIWKDSSRSTGSSERGIHKTWFSKSKISSRSYILREGPVLQWQYCNDSTGIAMTVLHSKSCILPLCWGFLQWK